MSTVGSLDTNVLLRLILQDVPEQHRAALELYRRTEGQLAVADVAIIEIAFVLGGSSYQFARSQIQVAVEGILSLPKLNCNRALFQSALSNFIKHPALSFEDCCLAAYAALNNAEPLWTFDRKLANQSAHAQLLA